MAECSIKLKVRISWWVSSYISMCALSARLLCMRPDVNKIGKFVVTHGVKVEVDNG